METHKIDQLFKQKLNRHSETVSADAFAKVQAQMKGKKQKKGFPWMIAASVSILLVVSFGLVYNFNGTDQNNIAKVDLSKSDLRISASEKVQIPEIKKEAQFQPIIQKTKDESVSKQSNTQALQVDQLSRMAAIEKVNAYEADFSFDRIPELRLSPQKQENKVIVEIHYAYAETKKEENLIEKSNNKLKSLASEFSLAELRSAKNELFASALQFNKKENN
jgi:hypothetical protein